MIAAQKIEECSRLQMFYQIRFLKTTQNSQENTCAIVSFKKKYCKVFYDQQIAEAQDNPISNARRGKDKRHPQFKYKYETIQLHSNMPIRFQVQPKCTT